MSIIYTCYWEYSDVWELENGKSWDIPVTNIWIYCHTFSLGKTNQKDKEFHLSFCIIYTVDLIWSMLPTSQCENESLLSQCSQFLNPPCQLSGPLECRTFDTCFPMLTTCHHAPWFPSRNLGIGAPGI